MNQKVFFSILIFSMLLSPLLAQEYSFQDEIEKYREEQNSEFLNPNKSPLTTAERELFAGHDFFKADESYRVKARFEATPDAKPFALGTSKGGAQIYKRIGILHFQLSGKEYTLEAYLQVQRFQIQRQKPIVFLPLVDETTGKTTYGGGRYMHYEGIPEGEEWVIDFNRLYNPYCAYSDKYECPMVPEPNHLPISIEAGIKGVKIN